MAKCAAKESIAQYEKTVFCDTVESGGSSQPAWPDGQRGL